MPLQITPQSLNETTTHMVLIVAPQGQVLNANPLAEAAYGYSRQELHSLSYYALCAEDELLVASQLENASFGGTVFEAVHRRRDGSTFIVEVSASPVELEGRPAVLCYMSDITLRRRQQSMLLLLREFDQRILQQQPLAEVLQHLCDGLSLSFGYPLVWVGTKQPDGSVAALARSGHADPLGSADVRWDDSSEGDGPTGTAIRTGRICAGTAAQVRAPLLSDKLAELGWDSVLALPLITTAGTLGALTLFGLSPHTFDSDSVRLLTDLADQVALAIVAGRHQEQVRLQTAALEAAACAVVVADASGRFTWVNPAFTALTGFTPAEAVGQPLGLLASGDHPAAFYAEMEQAFSSGTSWRGEVRNRCKDGSITINDEAITPFLTADGTLSHFVVVMQDVTERRRLEDQLRHMAMHDPVTNLPNLRALTENLLRLVLKGERGRSSSLLMIDVDNFSQVNGELGRAGADQVLIALSARLVRLLRPYDLLVRLTGDTFTALLEDADCAGAKSVAARLCHAVAAPFDIGGKPVRITVSVGVTTIHGKTLPKEVLAAGYAALQQAKQNGGNGCATAS